MSNSKFWNAFMFVMRSVGMVILYLLFCIPYLPLILVAGFVLIVVVLLWHIIILHLFGFWPAIIADILMVGALFGKWCQENENSRYKAELRVKKMRGETLEPWEYETIQAKPTAGLSFSDIVLGLFLWKLFFGSDSNKK